MRTSPVGLEHAAVPVVGVLVEAEVGHQHQFVTDGGAQGAQRQLDDAVGIPGPAALGVLVLGHAEEDQAGHAERGQPLGLGDQRVEGVLDWPGMEAIGTGDVDALAHEERRNQIVDVQMRVSATSRRRAGVRRNRRRRRVGKGARPCRSGGAHEAAAGPGR